MTCCCSFFRSCLDIVYVCHEQTCFEMFLLKRKFCSHCCSQKSTMIKNETAVLGCIQEPSWRDECKERFDSKKYRSNGWKQNLEMNEKRSLFKNIEEIYKEWLQLESELQEGAGPGYNLRSPPFNQGHQRSLSWLETNRKSRSQSLEERWRWPESSRWGSSLKFIFSDGLGQLFY